jgi:hypothetical protein
MTTAQANWDEFRTRLEALQRPATNHDLDRLRAAKRLHGEILGSLTAKDVATPPAEIDAADESLAAKAELIRDYLLLQEPDPMVALHPAIRQIWEGYKTTVLGPGLDLRMDGAMQKATAEARTGVENLEKATTEELHLNRYRSVLETAVELLNSLQQPNAAKKGGVA